MASLQAVQDSGVPVPALKARPDMEEWMNIYISGFNILSRARTSGFSGANPISLSEILAYVTMFNIPDAELFTRLISRMDDAFLEYVLKSK